jgi:hypothetical protein
LFRRRDADFDKIGKPDTGAVDNDLEVIQSTPEADVIVDDEARCGGHSLWTLEVERDELDPLSPNRSQQLLEELRRELLPSTAAIAEPDLRRAYSKILYAQQNLLHGASHLLSRAENAGRAAAQGCVNRLPEQSEERTAATSLA